MQPSDQEQVVRIAELEIDPAQLETYRSLLAEEIRASIKHEAGVIMLHAVAIRDEPSNIRILEVYANQAAYEAHLQTPHFLKYKTGTAGMVQSLRLIEAEAIAMEARQH